MKNHDQLMEDYEDALFALLMEAVAQQQGEALLEENERLKNDPDFAVPKESTKRNLRLIRRTILRRELAGVGRVAMKVLNKVAMIVLVAAAFFTTAFAAFPQFRADTLNLVMEVFEDKTKISFSSSGNSTGESTNNLSFIVGWVPEGYVLSQSEVGSTISWVSYKNTNGSEITICLDCMVGSTIDVDTEDATVQHTEINGHPTMIISKESELWAGIRIEIVMMDASREKIISITSYGLDEYDALHLAEEVIF